MILEQETISKFGYNPSSLSKGSNKKICTRCDYCGASIEISNKVRNKSTLLLDKDSCSKCKYKKMAELNVIRYGVSNVSQIDDVINKRRKNLLNKYGVDSYLKTDDFKAKKKESMLDRYGVEHALQNQIIKNKQVESASYTIEQAKISRAKTCTERFGSMTYLGSDLAKSKIRDTVLKKYGVDNVFKVKSTQEKAKQTNLSKLGVEYPLQSKEILEKVKNTSRLKYNTDFPCQSSIVRERINQTNTDRYGNVNPMLNEDVSKKARETAIRNGTIKIYDGKTIAELSEEHNIAYSTMTERIRELGVDKALLMKSKENLLEAKLRFILDELGVQYTQHARVNGRWTDFLIEEHKLILEADGLYWHSDAILDKNYHIIKKQDYNNSGYRVMFFRQDEIENKLSIVKSLIINAVSLSKKIYARKCNISTLSPERAKKFFNNNHLMGSGAGQTFCLEHGPDIVAAIQVKRIKNNNYEISRFCTLSGMSVVGGFSKLLQTVVNKLKPDNLITFIDMRYGGNGAYLKELGFIEHKSYPSFRWTDGSGTFHRLKFSDKEGRENNLFKIWDCGQKKFSISFDKCTTL